LEEGSYHPEASLLENGSPVGLSGYVVLGENSISKSSLSACNFGSLQVVTVPSS
jgi:hypothetical protein